MNENGDFVIIFRSCFENKKKLKHQVMEEKPIGKDVNFRTI